MNEEATRSSVGAIKKNYENTIERLNDRIKDENDKFEQIR